MITTINWLWHMMVSDYNDQYRDSIRLSVFTEYRNLRRHRLANRTLSTQWTYCRMIVGCVRPEW